MDDAPEVMEPVWDMTNRPQLADDDDEGEHYQAWMDGNVMRFRECGHGLTGPPPQREYRLVLTGPGERPEPAKGDRIDVGGNLFEVLDVTKAPEDSSDVDTVTLDLRAV